jgi:predicted acylesterase/phospholipase RssA
MMPAAVADVLKVLSIDGGGIRGIVPALVLAEIERRSGRRVAELFDMIAGTSTGGILACALTVPGEDGTAPAWRADEIVRLYEREGPEIFSRSPWQTVRTVGGLLDEKYPSGGIDGVLQRYFGEARLKQSLTRVLVTAYETERRFPFFFKSWRAQEDPSYDFPTRLVVRATAAAPTYFEPLKLDVETTADWYSLIDGGVYANNPAMCAYAEARRLFPGRDVFVVSLGTGELTRPIHWDEAKDWGLVEWVRPLLDVIFDGVSDTVDYQLRHVLPEGAYHRLQARLDEGSDDMDDATRTNLRVLKLTGERLIAERSAEIDAICARLAA